MLSSQQLGIDTTGGRLVVRDVAALRAAAQLNDSR
jgi:hypothetical protein